MRERLPLMPMAMVAAMAAMFAVPIRAGAEDAARAASGSPDAVVVGMPPFRSRKLDQKPAAGGAALERIEAIGAPTEFVPRSFRISSEKGIRQVELDSFAMSGPATIDQSNVDVRVLRWLPRGRQGAMSPEMLVKDDREVLKGVFPAGPEFPSIRTTGPVQTEIKAGEAKEFWVTFFIPENTPPGTYKGELALTLDGTTRGIPCVLDVLPIKLQKPEDVLWGIWFQIGWTDKDWSGLSEEERRKLNSECTFPRDVYEKYFKMTAECGFNTISSPAWDSPAYGTIMKLMKKYGMNGKQLFAYGIPWPYADKGQPETFTHKGMTLPEYTRKAVEFAKQNDFPLPLMGMEDENEDWKLQERRRALIKPAGSDTWMCVNNGWEHMHKVMGYPMANGGPWTRAASREAHRYGAAAGGYVQSWDPGGADGTTLRRIAGYGAWNLAADCFLPYTMIRFFADPYDETDGQFEDWITVYCSREGPVLTVRYAGHRAGVDDYRYVYTLEKLLESKEQALASDPDAMNRLGMIRADLNDMLMRNAYSNSDYEKDRRAVASLIVKAQGL
jgi:hypothetical protein